MSLRPSTPCSSHCSQNPLPIQGEVVATGSGYLLASTVDVGSSQGSLSLALDGVCCVLVTVSTGLAFSPLASWNREYHLPVPTVGYFARPLLPLLSSPPVKKGDLEEKAL